MIKRLGISQFWQNILSVFNGQALSQLIPLLSYIIIARLIDAEIFGIFAVWLGVAKLYSVMITLRLELALVNEPDGYERDKSVVLVILTAILMSFLFIITTTVLYFYVPESLSTLPLLSWFLLGPFALLLACDVILQTWAAADGRYGDLNKIRLLQASLISILQLALVYLFQDVRWLMIGACLGSFLALFVSNLIWPLRGFFGTQVWTELKAFWLKRKRFPMYSLPADSASSLIAQLPVLIVGSRFGLDTAGQLALTLKIMSAPVGLLGRAIQDVFKRYAAIDFATLGNCEALYKKMFMVLLPGGVLFIAATVGIGEQMFVLVFGEEWRQAGQYAVWLSPALALGFVVSPLSYIVYIVNRQNVDLIWQITLLVTVLLALLTPVDVMEVLFAYTLGYSLMYVAYIVITYRLSLGDGATKVVK